MKRPMRHRKIWRTRILVGPWRVGDWMAAWELKAQDAWIGVFWCWPTYNTFDVWVTIIPCLPFHIAKRPLS